MLIIVLPIFLLFFYLAYRRPLLSLSAAAALLPTYLLRFKVLNVPSTILEVIIWAIFFGWIIRVSFPRKQKSLIVILREYPTEESRKNFNRLISKIKKIKYPLAIFFLASIISIFIAPDKIAALGIWRAYFLESVLFLFLIFAIVKDKKDFEKIVFGLWIAAIYLSAIAVGQRFFSLPIPTPWQSELRATSVFPYPNALGLFLAPIIILVAGTAINYIKQKPALAYGALISLILPLAAIFFAKSDGAIIAVLAGATIFLLLWNAKSQKILLATIIIAIVLFSIFYFLNSNFLSGIKEKLLLRDWSVMVRLTIWSETWNMLKDNFVFGAGLSGYQTKILPYHESRAWMEVYLYPHNIIFNFWSELGILGLGAFIWLIEKFGRLCYSLMKREKLFAVMAITAMGALLIHGLVDVPFFKNDLSILFWIIYAMPFLI